MLGIPRENVRVITRYFGLDRREIVAVAAVAACRCSRAQARSTREDRRDARANVHERRLPPVTVQRVRLSADADGRLTWLGATPPISPACSTTTMRTAPRQHPTSTACRICASRAAGHNATSGRRPRCAARARFRALRNGIRDQRTGGDVEHGSPRVASANVPPHDEGLDLPFMSCHVAECYELGAKKIGWRDRTAAVGSMQRDGAIVGWGVAGSRGSRNARLRSARRVARQRARVLRDAGHRHRYVLDVAQIASDSLGIPLAHITVSLGDSSLPPGPISGGSMATASVIPAAITACRKR